MPDERSWELPVAWTVETRAVWSQADFADELDPAVVEDLSRRVQQVMERRVDAALLGHAYQPAPIIRPRNIEPYTREPFHIPGRWWYGEKYPAAARFLLGAFVPSDTFLPFDDQLRGDDRGYPDGSV